MTEAVKIKLKFERVLLELLKDDFKLTDDTILEKLVTHLSSEGSPVIDVPFCTKWVQSSFSLWLQGKIKAQIASFALRLLGILVQNESHFINIKNNALPTNSIYGTTPTNRCDVLEQFQKLVDSDMSYPSNFTMKFSCVKVLLSLLSHSSGCQWIVHTGLWENVLRLSLTDSSIYVARESRIFISRLLNQIPSENMSDAELILAQVMDPLMKVPVPYQSTSELVMVVPCLLLISDILERVFDTVDPDSNLVSSVVIKIVYKSEFNLVQKALGILKVANDEALEEQLSKILVFSYIFNIIKDGPMERKDRKVICFEIRNVFNILISKGSVHNVLKLCVVCHDHFTYVRKLNVEENSEIDEQGKVKKQYQFEDQLLGLQMVPFWVGCTLDQSTMEEIFLHQISTLMATENVKMIYSFRDCIVQKGLSDRVGLQAIAALHAVKTLFPLDRAVLIFQSFTYIVKHFVVNDESNIKHGGWGGELRQSHQSALLVAVLDGLGYLVRTYRITWRESVESLCLLSLALQLLDSPTLSSKVGLVVHALQLIRLCIENFMPPNLALLTNTVSETSFEKLGPSIYKRLHDPNWEIRDSALEVLHIIATISHHKYPLFQDLVLENKLCGMVVHLALNDSESYVCASATKCLTAMVCVDRLWNEELQDKDLVNKMIGVLSGESEGVLRREASLLMSQIFKHRKVTEDVLRKMYATMSHVVVSDLHWEVKVNALNFWELVIERSMNNQGMIDGIFPSVTFSKEHRKIVNLTPEVIKDHLRKVLDELSRSGCLHVLLAAIHCEEDLEVVKRSSQIIISLSKVLEQHGLLKHQSCPPSSSSEQIYAKSLFESSSLPETSCALTSSSLEIDSTSINSGKECIYSYKEYDDDKRKSIPLVGVDQHTMGLSTPEDDMPLLASHSLQEEVIDAILNDRDINLLASVYLGTEAELPGRQGPETKISKIMRPLVVMNPDIFLKQLEVLQVNQIVLERVRWIEDTGNHLGTLLDDMLIMRRVECDDDSDECNAMDCY